MTAPTPSMLIDVVDDRDHAVGTVPRESVLERGDNFRTAHVFVLDERDRLLLQRLAPKRPRHPNRWGSSVAAYLFAGETYEAAARRRLLEELGLEVPITQIGKAEMVDERSLKFVTLYGARSATPRNEEPGEISALVYRPLDWIANEIQRRRELFTPTFLALFERFGSDLLG
jgi:isopentenyl-diphosphate Delta-isomerase